MYQLPPLPYPAQRDEKDRQRWLGRFVEMGMSVRQDEALVWVGRRIDIPGTTGLVNWFEVGNGPIPPTHLRAVPLNEIAFDLGDDQHDDEGERHPTPWATTRLHAKAVCEACTRLGIPMLVSLSGGKGIHVEIFLTTKAPAIVRRGLRHDPRDDWRWPIALRILALANQILYGDTFWSEQTIQFDPRLIAPNEGSQLIREFGESKSPSAKTRKLLWHEGYGPVPDLPETREEAYAAAEALAAKRGSPRPQSPIAIAHGAKLFDMRWADILLGDPCPKTMECIETRCETCPAVKLEAA